MSNLRTAAQQALDDLKDLHTNHNITYAGTIWRLEAALAQEQTEPVATSAENATTEQQVSKTPPSDYRRSYLDGYFDGFAIGKREGRIEAEDAAKQAEPKPMSPEQRQRWEELAAMPQQAEPNAEYERGFIDGMQKQAQSSVDRAVNRMAEQAEPVQEPVAKVIATAPTRIWLDLGFDPADEDITFEQLFEATWSQDNATGWGIEYVRADLAAPPQRKPLTEEEIIDATEHIDTSRNGYFIDIARAVERAHGIGGQDSGISSS